MDAVEGEVELCRGAVAIARIDPATGVLHEPGHPLDGRCLAGKVLVCLGGKGSSSGSYVLLNLARRGLAPAAILVERADAVLTAGAVLAEIPIEQGIDLAAFESGRKVSVKAPVRRGGSIAWRILEAVGEAQGSTDMIPVASAHVGLSLSSLGEAGVDLLETLATQGTRFAVRTTTNVMSFEREDRASVSARLQRRALDALVKMGARANCSCNPFAEGHEPKRGEAVAWSESATAPFVNGVIGARTNREGATALASAITGVTPRYGMHLDSKRVGTSLFQISAKLDSLARFQLLGAAIARRLGSGVPVLAGLQEPLRRDWLYGLSAAIAAHSTAAVFHIVGVTPEAPDIASVFPQGAPEAIVIDERELEVERARWAAPATPPEYVVIGCPHASLEQIAELARLLEHARVRKETQFLVHTSHGIRESARSRSDLSVLERAGVRVTADSCMYVSLERYPAGATVLTDSAKMAFLMSTRGLRAALADIRSIVNLTGSTV